MSWIKIGIMIATVACDAKELLKKLQKLWEEMNSNQHTSEGPQPEPEPAPSQNGKNEKRREAAGQTEHMGG